MDLDIIFPSKPLLIRQCTITGMEDVIDNYTGLPIGIVKYYKNEKYNLNFHPNMEKKFYNIYVNHRLMIIEHIIILINIIRQKNIMHIINFHIIEYIFYKKDLELVRNVICN